MLQLVLGLTLFWLKMTVLNPHSTNIEQILTRSLHFLQWDGHPDQLDYGQLRLLMINEGKKGANLRSVAQKTHKEMVNIIPARHNSWNNIL